MPPSYLTRSRAIAAAKAAALLGLILLSNWNVSAQKLEFFLETARYAKAGVFVAIVLLSVAAFLVIPFLRSTALRIPLLMLTLGGYSANQVSVALSGQPLDATLVEVMWRERAMASDAMSSHAPVVLPTILWIAVAGVILAWRPDRAAALRARWALLPFTGFAACYAVASMTLGGTLGIPATFGVPAMVTVAATSNKYAGPRDPIDVAPVARPAYRNIVMIVDESIRGDILQINNAAHPTTPLLAGLGESLVNFGSSIASHNCSAAARVILRTGLTASDLPDTQSNALKVPTIWQYARASGFRTVLVDAFAEVVDRHSYMRPPEQTFIDQKVVISTPAVYMRDHEIAAEVLPALLGRPEPHFIYVNKYGAHFPYRSGYPPDFNGATAASPQDDLGNRDELLESYHYAVQWSVDEFFKTLLEHVDLSHTLILYTSDHGQSLLDGGYKLTHCSTGTVHVGEALVPMFAIAGPSPFTERLRQGAQAGFDRSTHFNVYPTLLASMGYDERWVTKRFGPSLLNVSRTAPRRFLTGDLFNATGEAKWVAVD